MHNRFELPSELTIYGVLAARDALLAWVSEHGGPATASLEISARAVGEVDGAGLQLLASLSNAGQAWHLVEASEAFADACRALGLGHWLGTQQQAAADCAGTP